MIVSRAAELGRLDELLDSLRGGDGRALVVRGDPGIGKTTLLDALAERCGDGVTVLRARGVETEAELAFAALSDLLAPVVDDLAALPAPQSGALAAALALGPPAPGDRLAVCVAALGLLRAAARERPVLAVVDDVHWLDTASRECVLYAARRAGGAVAVVVAARNPWDALEQESLPELRLEPFDPDASLEVLRRVAPDLAPPVAVAIVEAAAGNPLALVELPATLTADQRAGVAGVELPFAPGSRLHGAFAHRIEELDALDRRALLVAATHVGDDLRAITAACDDAGTDVGRLAQAEERGLVRIGAGHVRFVHPIIRGAAYHAASPAERRRAHRALGSVLGGERRAWHAPPPTPTTRPRCSRSEPSPCSARTATRRSVRMCSRSTRGSWCCGARLGAQPRRGARPSAWRRDSIRSARPGHGRTSCCERASPWESSSARGRTASPSAGGPARRARSPRWAVP